MEKLLVAQALDERDLLKKKIEDAIRKAEFVIVCKEKEDKINGIAISDIEEKMKSTWQSINDMIDRYERINKAIIQSNAVTTITFKDGTTMTKAEAIARKKSKSNVDFKLLLITFASNNYTNAITKAAMIESAQAKSRDQHITSMLSGSDKKVLDEESANAIEGFVKPFGPKWIDPLNIKEKIDKLQEQEDSFNAEVETLLKISNATTEIEF